MKRLLFLIATLLVTVPSYGYEEALLKVPTRRKFTHRDIRCGYDTSSGNWIREYWGPKCNLEFDGDKLIIEIRESGKRTVIKKEQILRMSHRHYIHVKTEEGVKFLTFMIGHASRNADFWIYLDMWLHTDLGEKSLE